VYILQQLGEVEMVSTIEKRSLRLRGAPWRWLQTRTLSVHAQHYWTGAGILVYALLPGTGVGTGITRGARITALLPFKSFFLVERGQWEIHQ
jgi:hypothetical protein